MKLANLKPRVGTLTHRLQVAQPLTGYSATPRDRGRPWMRRRARWLWANPLCCHCQAAGLTTAATEVDHRIPLWKGGADDETNYQSLCHPCHATKTAEEAQERGRLGLLAKP